MWLISPRPRVELHLSSEPRPGSYLEGEVRLVADQRCEIRKVVARLIGLSRTFEPLGLLAQTVPWGDLEARLAGRMMIPPGTTSLRLRMWLPERFPPTHAIGKSAYFYSLQIEVIVPGLVDERTRFPVVVGFRAAEATLGHSATASRGGSLFRAEIAVDDDLAAPGQRLFGRFSVHAGHGASSARLTAALIACHGDPYTKGYSSGLEVVRVELPPEQVPADGTVVPFSIEVPEGALPTIDSDQVALRWLVGVVSPGGRAAPLVEVPVRVLPPGTRAERGDQKAPPIGSARLELELAKAAEGTSLRVEGGGLKGPVGEVSVEIDTPGPRARLTFPSLGIGLRLGSPSVFEELFDVGARPRDHTLRELVVASGREGAQAQAVLGALEPALSPFSGVIADDSSCHVFPRGNADSVPLAPFVRAVVSLAEAFRAARASLPPPALLAPGIASWSALASQLEGDLEVGSVKLRGRREGHPVEAGIVWTPRGVAAATFVAVRPLSPLPPGTDFAWSPGPLPPSLPPSARPAFERAAEGAEALSLDASGLRLTLARPAVDASPLLARVDALVDLCVSLEGRGSPYR